MLIREFDHPGDFQAAVTPLLLENEAENNLLLGITGRLAATGARTEVTEDERPLLWCVEDEGRIVTVAIRTPPHKLVLTRGPAVAVAMLADLAARKRFVLPGVVGPAEPTGVFVCAWGKLSRQTIRPGKSLGIYMAEQVSGPAGVSGSFHEATADESELLVEWWAAFRQESQIERIPDERKLVEEGLKAHQIFIWKDPHPVSFAASYAAYGGLTPNGARITTVYTPPPYRRRGYASACVAALTQRLLDGGRRFCFLFTDLSDREANSIYRRIGYRQVSEYREFGFEEKGQS